MALFGKGVPRFAGGPLQDPKWARSERGSFHRLVHIDPEQEGLDGVSGVYVVWHAGIRPAWVYVGRSTDLARTFHDLGNNDDVMSYEVHGGLFISWALIRHDYQDGVVRFLTDTMAPLVANPAAPGDAVEPVPVAAPGGEGTT